MCCSLLLLGLMRLTWVEQAILLPFTEFQATLAEWLGWTRANSVVVGLNTANEKRHDVARLLSRIPGIDLCVSRGGEAVRVFGSQGTGIIRRKRGELDDVLFSYEWRQVDPLGLEPVIEQLGIPDGPGSPAWFSDSRWFEATQLSEYPDPLYRLYHSFEAAKHPASLLCSMESGYAFGATGLEWLSWLAHGDMRWTHGSLKRADSLGFIMTNGRHWRPRQAVRFNEALRFLREPAGPSTLRQATSAPAQ